METIRTLSATGRKKNFFLRNGQQDYSPPIFKSWGNIILENVTL